MSDYLEIERKFDVDPGFGLPDLGSVPGIADAARPERYHLVATYFDTPDQRLAAHKITLRRRTGGSDEGWHLKLPASQAGRDARQEVRAPLADGSADGTRIPASLAARVAGITAGAPVVPIAVLVTERTVHTLTGTSGEVAAEVADDVVTGERTAAADGGDPLSWREIEVELGPAGTPALLDATAKLLRAAGARPSRSPSKLARVLG
ncbi:MAG: CYTH domain-containing protein [Streptosporangiaceae bacterium]|nr:CYTH domain-containing protein [Streptosporangiaceae bacterium]MBV9856608.1 CYTH domain-containing protein [Streptosporangiaceae bacterium]